jgi:hypothetical protein
VIAAGTAVAGWWSVPLLAALWVRALPRRRTSVLSTAAGAVLGWALLLAWAASQGPVAVVARRVGGILQLPARGFIVLTLAVPALLAGTAARLVQPARRR